MPASCPTPWAAARVSASQWASAPLTPTGTECVGRTRLLSYSLVLNFMGKPRFEESKYWAQEHMNSEAQGNTGCILGSYQFLSLYKVVWAPKMPFCKFPINISLGKYSFFKRKKTNICQAPTTCQAFILTTLIGPQYYSWGYSNVSPTHALLALTSVLQSLPKVMGTWDFLCFLGIQVHLVYVKGRTEGQRVTAPAALLR